MIDSACIHKSPSVCYRISNRRHGEPALLNERTLLQWRPNNSGSWNFRSELLHQFEGVRPTPCQVSTSQESSQLYWKNWAALSTACHDRCLVVGDRCLSIPFCP